MEKLNKKFSFLCLLFATLSCVCGLEVDGFIKLITDKIMTSQVMIVYLNDNLTDNKVEDVKKIFDDFEEIELNKFNDSAAAYDMLKKDPFISGQMDLIKNDFILPSFFEVSIRKANVKKIERIVNKIESLKEVQYVDIEFDVIKKIFESLHKVKVARILIALLILTFSLFFLYMSGYLYVLSNKDELYLAREVSLAVRKALLSLMTYQLIRGVLAGLFGLITVYMVVKISGLDFYINVFEAFLAVSGISILAALLCGFNGLVKKHGFNL